LWIIIFRKYNTKSSFSPFGLGVVEKFCLFGVQNNENGVPYNGTLFAKKANYQECQRDGDAKFCVSTLMGLLWVMNLHNS